jgi:hypothetical protein
MMRAIMSYLDKSQLADHTLLQTLMVILFVAGSGKSVPQLWYSEGGNNIIFRQSPSLDQLIESLARITTGGFP